MPGAATTRLEIPRRLVLAGGVVALLRPTGAEAATRHELEAEGREAMTRLYQVNDKARDLASRSVAVMIFPRILKAGLMIGGQGGEGVLFQNGRAQRFYRIAAASYGLQIGAQTFSYVMFFTSPAGLEHLDKTHGWTVGSGPSLVFLDEAKSKNINTATLTGDVYAMAFGQQGLMAGGGLEGSKITEIYPDP